MIKIGIDPSGTGTTAIVVFKDNKLIDKTEIKNKDWLIHAHKIKEYIREHTNAIINIENCLYTNAGGSIHRDNLLRLLGVIENYLKSKQIKFNLVAPHHTKSVVKNIKN